MDEFAEAAEAIALRLAALQDMAILDSAPEPEFDDAVLIATALCQAPVALISLVTDRRQWFKARRGFPACETELDQSVCKYAMNASGLFVIPDLSRDPRTATNSLVTGDPGIRFYAGAPLVSDSGVPVGSLCVIDTVPRPDGLTEAQGNGLMALARQTMALINTRRMMQRLEAAKDAHQAVITSELAHERRLGSHRETFVAVLGHDLRNPLAALDAGIRLIEREAPAPRSASVLAMMKLSVGRMRTLIETTLDFARVRLGTGMGVTSHADAELAPMLEQVVSELRVSHPKARIVADIRVTCPVACDRYRIGQMLSNLLANALLHGDNAHPVRVEAATADGRFVMSVANGGNPIPPAWLDMLFEPFVGSAAQGPRQGLGLGLYIASEVARAHQGTLSATSTAEETRFTFEMPLRPA